MIYYLLSGAVGIVAAVYLPMNGRLGEEVGSPLLATAIFFSIGAITAITAWLAFGDGDTLKRMSNATKPLFLLGIVSFGIILCATIFIPKLGPGAYFVCLVTGQVITGILLSHFGFFTSQPLPITSLKAFGASAVLIGVFCIYFSENPYT